MSRQRGVKPEIPGVSRDVVARGTFAAILAASEGNCDCEACKILRKVKDAMKEEFL
ncbi:MAG: hypothetical protein ACE5OO_00370 [Candidatus Bathyarchaeia archaeon]